MDNPWIFDGDLWEYPHIGTAGIAELASSPTVWTFDGSPWGYPHIRRAGLAEKEKCPSVWTFEQGKHFDFPFIRRAGLAAPYEQGGIFKLFHGADKVTSAFIGAVEVKKVYYRGAVVFEK